MFYLVANDVLLFRKDGWQALEKKTGPNDARRVVWALGKSFVIYIRILLLLKV